MKNGKQLKNVFDEKMYIEEVEPDYLQSIIKKWFEYYMIIKENN